MDTDGGFVFTNKLGRMFDLDHTSQAFKQVAKHAIGRKARFHDMRHTYATSLIRAGVDVKTVSVTMGHSTVAYTIDIYCSAPDEQTMNTAASAFELAMANA
jgi:integrase